MIPKYIAFILIVFTVFACKETAQKEQDKLESESIEKKEEVGKISNKENARMLEAGEYFVLSVGETSAETFKPYFNLNIEENRISGFSGCNTFTGSLATSRGSISLDQIASTRKMCAEAMEFENDFLKALGQIEKYNYKGLIVQFKSADGKVLLKAKMRE